MALLILVFAALAARAADLDRLSRQFDYDSKAPLDIQQTLLTEGRGLKVYDITYASPKGGRVPAYLVAPDGKGPFAGIVFANWGPGTRTEFLPEAKLYAKAGAVSVLVEYPWNRPAAWWRPLGDFRQPERDRDTEIQAAIDLRRAFDLLLARPDVDPKRVAYVGHSFGAQFGAILSAIDKRMQATVLVGGVPDQNAIYLENEDNAGLVELRKKTPREVMDKYLQTVDSLSAVRYIPYAAPVPLLFQFARYEQYFNEAAMQRFLAAASQPKTVRWYETGHDLNDLQTLVDRGAFLENHIGIKPLGPLLGGVRADVK